MVRFFCNIFIFLGLVVFQYNDNSDWQLAKQKDEITIYTRKVGYSNYKEFKGELIVSSTPENVVECLRKVEEYREWLPDCLESKKLSRTKDTVQINYILTDVPWPFDDRDLIYEFKVLQTEATTGQFQILIENKPNYIEQINGIVRIPKSKGLWIITPISDKETKLVYQMHVEPGGYVPAWLANLKITDTPFTFLSNLRIQVEH